MVMDKIAFISGGTIVYWNSILYTLAVAVAICFFLAFYLRRCGNAVAGFAVIPVAIVFSVILARFAHWYSRADSYDGFLAAMTDYTSGGYALIGVFGGCALAACLVRLLFLTRNLPELLDSLCLGGCAGICVGRLAAFFNSSDRGNILENFTSLPFAWPVTNAVSGAVEYRLATFLFQALVALALLIVLGDFYGRDMDKKKLKDGDLTLIFLMLYGSSQVVLDSTRYDSLFFRSNGFVSVVQVFGALALALAIIVFSRRMVKALGFRFWQVPLWILIAAGIGCGGFMEYYVQRHGSEAVFAYSVMSGCLVGVIALTLLIRYLAVKKERKMADFV